MSKPNMGDELEASELRRRELRSIIAYLGEWEPTDSPYLMRDLVRGIAKILSAEMYDDHDTA